MNQARRIALGGVSALLMAAASAPAMAQDEYRLPAFEPTATDDANYRYPDESTPLMWAVYEGDAERAARLIDAGADVNAANLYGSNAMQLAAEVANAELLEMLLEAGADADSANPEGQTALMLVARTGEVEAARLLVDHGADVNAREGWGEQTALMWAAARRHPQMVEFLIEAGAEMDVRSKWRDYQRHITSEARAKSLDTGGLSPLLFAVRENCISCVDVLIEHGADVDMPDPDRVTPLLLSILNGNWDISVRLIEAGADVNKFDMFGQAPLFAVAGSRTDSARTSIDPLNEATGTQVMDMLLAEGANPNMQLFLRPAKQRGGSFRGSTPLHRAAGGGDLVAVQKLLDAGADVNLNTSDNQTALMFAAQARGSGGLEVMDALAEAGADVNANALYHHLARIRGGTALHYAVRSGNGNAIDRLVSYGADVNIKDPDGLTALDYAEARGYIPFLQSRQAPRKDLAEKLRAAGADVELAEEPYWPPVGPPIYYEATIWPMDPTVPSRTYEGMDPSPFMDPAMEALEYPGTPQPAGQDKEKLENKPTDQASLNDQTTNR